MSPTAATVCMATDSPRSASMTAARGAARDCTAVLGKVSQKPVVCICISGRCTSP
jgi:hypothetical protein